MHTSGGDNRRIRELRQSKTGGVWDMIDTDYEIGQDKVEGSVGPFDFDI